MNIEVLKFYPIERNDQKERLIGSATVYIVDLDIHLLGVFVERHKNYWYVGVPCKMGIHHETGKKVKFPTFAFGDKEKNSEFVSLLKEKVVPFVKEYLEKNPQPIPIVQEELIVEKPKPKKKVWMDMPKKKK